MNITSVKFGAIADKIYEPIGNRVLLSCPKEEINGHVNVDGILVPEGESRKKNPIIEMTVEAAGPDCKQVSKGATVLFNLNNASATPRGDLEYRWTEEQFILAIVREREHADAPTD